MSLKSIDFSNGIRSEDIQYNFNEIENQVARERLAVSGHGVSTGLEFTINNFDLVIGAGSLIDLDGKEIFLPTTVINIPYPRITKTKETVYTVQTDGKILLPDIPYSLSRKYAAQYDLPINYGISIIDYNNSSKTLPVMSINTKTITTDNRWSGQLVKVTYHYSNKRYDTVYIDNDNQIKLIEGITSNSPSILFPEESKYKYILGIVEVNPFYLSDNRIVAHISVEKDMKSLRNVYTDKNNNLFIRGVMFEDLQIIHMVEPPSPTENQLWYDSVSNKLRVWKTIDGISEWTNVNDTSIIPVREHKIWTPQINPSDRQMFIFHKDNDLNMRFVPGRNELEIYIDNGPLHSDQFEEITAAQAKTNPTLKELLISSFGYTDEWIQEANVDFENVGIGFKLAQPLDKPCFVEARATHRVNDNPIRVRFQRSATFVETDSFNYVATNGKVITTNAPYRLGENQLEVFIEGKRLDAGIHYTEGVDLAIDSRIKGASSYQFQITADIAEYSRISYKISSSIYSYDNVEKVVGDLATRVTSAEQSAASSVQTVNQIANSTNTNLASMQTQINNVVNKEAEHDTFVKKTDKLETTNMSDTFNSLMPKGLINFSIVKSGNVFPVTGVYPEDFVTMFDMQATGGNSILRRDTDYSITRDQTSGITYINMINTNAVADGHTLYLTGIKFKS